MVTPRDGPDDHYGARLISPYPDSTTRVTLEPTRPRQRSSARAQRMDGEISVASPYPRTTRSTARSDSSSSHLAARETLIPGERVGRLRILDDISKYIFYDII